MRIFKGFYLFILFTISLASGAQNLTERPDTLVVIDDLVFVNNKVTAHKIMTREISFRPGDTLGVNELKSKIEQSRKNLMNTSLFNFVELKDSVVGVGVLERHRIEYHVIERWYIWPLPIFQLAERNLNTWLETKDFSRINYGMFLTWENFRGRRENLKILLQFGYDQKLGFSYSIPYIDKKQTIGLDFGFSQTRNHEADYNTVDNKVVRVKLADALAHREYKAFLMLTRRPSIYQTHSLELSYNDHIFADTIFELNPDFYLGTSHRAQFFKLSYFFKNDHRDFKTFPLQGYYVDLLLEKHGLGVFSGNAIDLLEAKVNARKYWKLHRRIFFAAGITARVGNYDQLPYFLKQGIGYGRDFVRGYEYYVVDGINYGILKTEFKFAIVPQQVTVIKFIPTEKFNKIPWAIYMSLHSDAGYAPGKGDFNNDLQNKLLLGYGVGLNLVTYYDMVFRIDYSFNQLGQSGWFIHFMTGI